MEVRRPWSWVRVVRYDRTKMKRIFEVRADQGWLSSRAPESFIWWFNGGAWQNVKGVVRVGRISSSFGYSNENFTNSFFFPPLLRNILETAACSRVKTQRNQYAPILRRYRSTKLKCERSDALIETGCRGKMVNVIRYIFCQRYRYRDGENTIESKWMYDRWINCATCKKKKNWFDRVDKEVRIIFGSR